MPTLDDLHLAMGEFLTESSAVEDMMLGLYIVCNPDRPMGEIFNDFVDQTFGGKIKKFKQACDAHPFTEEQRSILREVYSRIDAVLPKRNYIVHGTTYELGEEGVSTQPYRIGRKRGDLSYMSKAVKNDFSGENVFSTLAIASVTHEFVSIQSRLAEVSVPTINVFWRKPE